MPLTNAPAAPQLDLTHPLAATLQSLVLFDGAGLPRNLVTNTVPRRWLGGSGLNFGEDPVWLPGSFSPDSTPSAMLRFASNSRSLAYPYGGVSGGTARGASQDKTHFAIFAIDAIDLPAGSTVRVSGQGRAVYGDTGLDGAFFDGIAITSDISGNAYLSYAIDGLGILLCKDSTGATTLCPLIAGHIYFAAIAVSRSGDSFQRFYLWDYTANALVSPTGSQYFDGGFGIRGANERYNNWEPSAADQPYFFSDHLVFPGVGGVVRVRLAGVDNQVWDTTAGTSHNAPPTGVTPNVADYVRSTPYVMMTGTRNASGSPPTALAAAASSYVSGHQTVYQGQTAFVAGSTLSGVPSGLPLVAVADCAVSRISETAVEFSASAPAGAPHAVASWKLYGSSAYPPSTSGSPLVTSSVLPLVYSPPDVGIRWYQLTATDTTGTVYIYPVVVAALRSRAPVRMLVAGNSIATTSGNVYSAFVAASAIAQYRGFDLAIATLASDGAGIAEWLPSPSPLRPCFGAPGGSVGQLDWLLFRAQQEHTATGWPVDAAILQISGNSPGTSGQYASLSASILSGVGASGTFTASVSAVHLAAGPLQLAGHPLDANASILANNSAMASAANGTTIFAVGSAAQRASVVAAYSYLGGHPDPAIAAAEGAGWVEDYLASVTPAGGTVPDPSNVRLGTAVASTVGTLHVPTAAQVLSGIAVDATTGTVVLPTAAQVQAGVGFGPASGTTGTVVLPTAGQVQSGVSFGAGGSTTGTLTGGGATATRVSQQLKRSR